MEKKRLLSIMFLVIGALVLCSILIYQLKAPDFLITSYRDIHRYRHLTEVAGVFRPTLIEYPEWITFVGNAKDHISGLFRVDLQQEKIERMFPDETINFYAWNQERTQLAFISHNLKTGDDGYYIYQPESNQRRNLSEGKCRGVPESWAPDNSKIITIGACGDPLRPCLCSLSIATGIEEVIYQAKNINDGFIEAAWSPDGNEAAFIYGTGPHGLYVIDMNSKQTRELINISGVSIHNPRWLKGGEWLSFIIEEGDFAPRLGIIRRDGRCKRDFLPTITGVSRFDVLEESADLHFLIVDTNNNMYTFSLNSLMGTGWLEEFLKCSEL